MTRSSDGGVKFLSRKDRCYCYLNVEDLVAVDGSSRTAVPGGREGGALAGRRPAPLGGGYEDHPVLRGRWRQGGGHLPETVSWPRPLARTSTAPPSGYCPPSLCQKQAGPLFVLTTLLSGPAGRCDWLAGDPSLGRSPAGVGAACRLVWTAGLDQYMGAAPSKDTPWGMALWLQGGEPSS